MIITFHREKLINAIIYFADHTRFCGKTKLMKLLYFLDFKHFKQTGKSVTGLDYFAWEMGPVPKKLFEEISCKMRPDIKKAIHIQSAGEKFQKIISKSKFNSRYFSKKELKLMEDIAFIFKDARAEDMVESTHLKNEPWDRTLKEKGMYQPIDYLLAIDSDVVSLPYDEAKERLNERMEIYNLFGEI
jgi:uncharacterized phage-associated protein